MVTRLRDSRRANANGVRFLEARGGIEPPMKVLQTFALPLGYRATDSEEMEIAKSQFPVGSFSSGKFLQLKRTGRSS
jgi:hypothetical protein